MFRTFQQRSRFCTNLCEEDLLRLRQSAGLLEDEAVCLLIDDSFFGNRAKNVILTDRRILWQEKRRVAYRSVLLSALKGASVFAGQRGYASVITILNGGERVSLVFKNVRECEPLRVVFHDYFSRCCEGYNPLDEENAHCYEKEFLLPQRKRDLVSAVLAAAGSIFFLLFVLIQQCGAFSLLLESLKFDGYSQIEFIMLALALICWAANVLLPASKSKMIKSALLLISLLFFSALFASFLSWGDISFGLALAAVFLLADRFDTTCLEPALAIVATILGLLIAGDLFFLSVTI